MKEKILKLIGNQNGLLLFYHKIKAIIALIVYWNPSKKLKVIGVTGTDGKTTTVNLIADLLEAAGYKVGLTSTVRYKIGDVTWSNREKMSTNSPFFVQKMLRRMVNAGCDYAIVEVTSHSVVQSRIYGINFDVAVFTNLSEDHLEYHGSFENYMRAKGRFFAGLFGMRRKEQTPKVIVLNGDDLHFEYFDQFQGDLKLIYGIQKGGVKATDIILSSSGTEYNLVVPNAEQHIKTNMLGEFNVYNSLAAISVAVSQGISLPVIAEAFKKIFPVGGRLEAVNVGQNFAVVLDYAHTHPALEKACAIFKGLTKGRLILVFGATGGGRDKLKRPIMGGIADKYADLIVLTTDDPYFDDPYEIIENIAAGINRTEGDRLFKIVDREEAIRFALLAAAEHDTVLITGKGGEEVIVLKDKLVPYEDKEVVRRILSEQIYNQIKL